jgi:hypothetical protein
MAAPGVFQNPGADVRFKMLSLDSRCRLAAKLPTNEVTSELPLSNSKLTFRIIQLMASPARFQSADKYRPVT